ncbi:acetylornithine deacetylase [Acidovorax sp. 69]|uniref:ArgE/DapE family deacylase n=1 Tax=Acidovorax sp. 69 TaxID=2035202 RepID=UPI000C2345D9|nr:ArgE/DapE family deacylase [Acidovorax sp. 69]PJI98060.1 acetylornithine deacetylase [Acidovorax sp. 69]
MPQTAPSPAILQQAVDDLHDDMIDLLGDFVATASLSGAEQAAADFLEKRLQSMGLDCERIVLDSHLIASSPLFSCPCDPDGGRHNLLARHLPRQRPDGTRGRSVLFNGHLDVVPTGPEALWTTPPFQTRVEGDWLYGRGAGDMKGGIVCALMALQALRRLGLQPAGVVGINAVLDEENTGNGTLATVHALRNSMAKARLSDFDTVIIPEPFAETMMAAQVGVSWLFVTITGRPAHVAYKGQGLNPIEAGMALVDDLKQLEAEWNRPENRHPAFQNVEHPVNFNLGRIEGGEWNSSVPCTCTLGLRLGYYPDADPDTVVEQVSRRLRAKAQALNPALQLEISTRGHRSPGCIYPLDSPAMQTLAMAHRSVHGRDPEHLACTATTDGRHFSLLTDIPVTNYGPVARNIHGIDESVSLASLRRVTRTFAQFIIDWCGVEDAEEKSPLLNRDQK